MSKDTFYFSHDYNCRSDVKIKKLLAKHGYLGYGLFWAIIEDLYNNTNVLQLDYDSIAFDLRCDKNTVKSIINDFDLFVINGDKFGSLSIEKRLEERNKKSEKARQSVLKRWSKDTNVLRTYNDSNTIKESKVKESKINKEELLSNKKEEFRFSLVQFVEEFGKETVREFFNHWTELNASKTKMRFQSEKFFDLKKRLTTWKNNESKFKTVHSQFQKTIITPEKPKQKYDYENS